MSLRELVAELGLKDKVIFHGCVAYEQVPEMLNRLDIYVALSRMESFGVAVLEAASCAKPVVVSDAEGLAEVTAQGVNGFIVPKNDFEAAGNAMIKLIRDDYLRKTMGSAGREHVLKHYSWGMSLDMMLNAYEHTIKLSQ